MTFETIRQSTIIRTPSGHNEVSVLVESESQTLDKTGKQIGLDVEPSDLSIRSWVCSSCDTTHDRDIDAGKNILNRALFPVN